MVSHDAEAEAQIFISYSRRDFAFAQWLVDALNAKGFGAYLDKVDIAPGEPWQDRLADLILASDTVVFVVTANSVASGICAWELDEARRSNKRIFPIVAERIPEPSAPSNLRSLNWIFCADGDDRTDALDRLDHALRANLPWIREHTRLTGLASRWHNQSRAGALTLRGPDLNGAEDWLARRPTELAKPTDLQRDFIRASRRAAIVRQRWFGGSSAVIVAFSLTLAGWAELNRRDAQLQRDEATAQRVEAEKHRDRAEEALKNVELQRDRAEKALANVVDFGASLYMATASVADLLGSAPGSDNAQSISLMQRLIDTGDELAHIMSEKNILDAATRRARSLSLAHAGKFFVKVGRSQLAISVATRSVQLTGEILAEDRSNEDAIHLLAEAWEALGDANWAAEDVKGAEASYEEGLRVLEDGKAGNPAIRRRLAYSLLRIGYFRVLTHRKERGQANIEAAIGLFCQIKKQAESSSLEEAERDLAFAIKFANEKAGVSGSCP